MYINIHTPSPRILNTNLRMCVLDKSSKSYLRGRINQVIAKVKNLILVASMERSFMLCSIQVLYLSAILVYNCFTSRILRAKKQINAF